MNSYTKEFLRLRRSEGDTAEQAATAVNEDPRFARELRPQELLAYAQRNNVDIRLDATIAHPQCPDALKIGIRRFERAATSGIPWHVEHSDVATVFHDWLTGMLQFYQDLGDPYGLTEQHVSELAAYGGGRLLDTVTKEEVQAFWDLEDAIAEGLEALNVIRQRSAQAEALYEELERGNLDALAELQALV